MLQMPDSSAELERSGESEGPEIFAASGKSHFREKKSLLQKKRGTLACISTEDGYISCLYVANCDSFGRGGMRENGGGTKGNVAAGH